MSNRVRPARTSRRVAIGAVSAIATTAAGIAVGWGVAGTHASAAPELTAAAVAAPVALADRPAARQAAAPNQAAAQSAAAKAAAAKAAAQKAARQRAASVRAAALSRAAKRPVLNQRRAIATHMQTVNTEHKVHQLVAGNRLRAASSRAAMESYAQAHYGELSTVQSRIHIAQPEYTLPVRSYRITATFDQAGSHWSHRHTGLDFAAPTGTAIHAVSSGTVTSTGWAGAYGNRTKVQFPDGTVTWYCHQSSIRVRVGQHVTVGQVIGLVGATGNTTGPHLHLEVHPHGGDAVDPMSWLRGKGLTP